MNWLWVNIDCESIEWLFIKEPFDRLTVFNLKLNYASVFVKKQWSFSLWYHWNFFQLVCNAMSVDYLPAAPVKRGFTQSSNRFRSPWITNLLLRVLLALNLTKFHWKHFLSLVSISPGSVTIDSQERSHHNYRGSGPGWGWILFCRMLCRGGGRVYSYHALFCAGTGFWQV